MTSTKDSKTNETENQPLLDLFTHQQFLMYGQVGDKLYQNSKTYTMVTRLWFQRADGKYEIRCTFS